MDEKVIYSSQQAPIKPEAPQPQSVPPMSPASVVEPISVAPSPTSAPPSPQPISEPSSLPKPPRPSPLGSILKIVGIGVVVLLLIFLIFRFVVPLFNQTKKEEAVTLTYWGLFEDKNVMNTIVSDFHRTHPTITVNYIQKDIKQYRQSLVTQISAGNGPDIYRFHNSWVGMMKSFLSPMTADVIPSDEFKKNYYPVIQQDLVRNGALYGIPLEIDTLSLFVNTELFAAGGNAVPTTWDEFIRVAKDRVVKDSGDKIQTAGAALGTYDNITHAPDIISLLMAQNGTSFTNFSSTLDNTSQALQFYTAFAKDEGSVWDSTLDPSVVAFSKGNLAMYFGYSWDIFAIKALNPDLQFSIHPVPNLPSRKMAMASYWVEGVSVKSKHQKEAMLFMNYLTKKETLQKLYTETAKTRLFGEPYPRSDLANSIKSNPYLASFLEQAPYAISSYFVSDTYDDGINSQMDAYLGNAIRSTQADDNSMKTAVDALAQGVNQVLGKYGR